MKCYDDEHDHVITRRATFAMFEAQLDLAKVKEVNLAKHAGHWTARVVLLDGSMGEARTKDIVTSLNGALRIAKKEFS